MGTGRLPLVRAATPFTEHELRARYASRAEYERGWIAAVDTLVASGAPRSEDASAIHARVADVRLPF